MVWIVFFVSKLARRCWLHLPVALFDALSLKNETLSIIVYNSHCSNELSFYGGARMNLSDNSAATLT